MAKTSIGSKHKKQRGGERIVFDRQARIDFVTGFRKRKNERREYAKTEIKEEEKDRHRQFLKQKREQKNLIHE